MKKLVLFGLLVSLFATSKAQFTLTNSSTTSIVELRSGTWPLDLQRVIKQNDTAYVLSFRDQQYSNVVNMSILKFKDKGQLKYFQQALSSLAQLEDGTIANFKDYTIKRADMKKDNLQIEGSTPDPAPAPKATPAKKDAKPVPPAPKKPDVWYLLTCNDGTVTNFRQSEANKMIAAIQPL